jgi:hypothetical protein
MQLDTKGMKIEFNSENHSYLLNGVQAPSVTTIIKEIIGCAWEASDWYLERGTVVHACAHLIAQGKNFKFDEQVAGEISALKRFFEEVKPEVIASEIFVASEIYHYCGTLDFACRIGRDLAIVDWKASVDKLRTPIQIGGYSQAYKEMFSKEINAGYGVEIKSNGTYSMTPRIDLKKSRNQFLALRTAYALRESAGLLESQKKEI